MRSDVRLQQLHRRGMSLSSVIANDRDDDLILFRDMHRKEQEIRLSVPSAAIMLPSSTKPKASTQAVNKTSTGPRPVKNCVADDILASEQDKNDYNWLMTPPSTPIFLNGDHAALSRTGSKTLRSMLRPSKLQDSKADVLLRPGQSLTTAHENCSSESPSNLIPGVSPRSTNISDSASSIPPKSSVARPPIKTSLNPSRLMGAGVAALKGSFHSSVQSTSASALNKGSHTMTSGVYSTSSSRPTTPVKRMPSPGHHCNPPSTLVRCSSANRATSLMAKGAPVSGKGSTSVAGSSVGFNGLTQQSSPIHHMQKLGRTHSLLKGKKSSEEDSGERKDLQHRWKPGSPLVTKRSTTNVFQNGENGLHRSSQVDNKLAPRKGKVEEQVIGAESATARLKQPQGSVVSSIVKKPTMANSLRDVKAIISSVRGSAPKKSSDPNTKRVDSGKSASKSATNKFRSFMSSMAKSTLMPRKPMRSITSSVINSPMATSSNTSSEQNMGVVIDPDGIELGDECISERGSRSSSASQHDFALGREKRIHSLLRGPECNDDDAEIMQIFEQEGLGSLSGPESPLITELEGTIECDNFSLGPPL